MTLVTPEDRAKMDEAAWAAVSEAIERFCREQDALRAGLSSAGGHDGKSAG